METVEIGIIGMGDMGRLYATKMRDAGWKKVNVCDRPENYDNLRKEFEGSGLNVLRDGHLVSRRSDFIIYSVEAAFIDKVVEQYGSSTRIGSIVADRPRSRRPKRLLSKSICRKTPTSSRVTRCTVQRWIRPGSR